MAFDINRLKNKQEEFDLGNVQKLKSYLDTEEFEDSLQEYLENEIDYGKNVGQLALTVEGSPTGEITMRLTSRTSSLIYDICTDIPGKVGDLSRYTELIENKLTDLKLNFQTEFPENVNVFKMTSESLHLFKFIIILKFND